MPKYFRQLTSRPFSLISALKRIAVSGLIASAGLSATPQAAATASVVDSTIAPSIVDRSRKIAKLILKLPGTAASFVAQHRSHRSHSSHRSHYSGSGGGGGAVAAPAPVPVAPPVRAVPPPPPVTPSTSLAAVAVPTNTVTGEVVSIDAQKRLFVFKQSKNVSRTIGYRDDTKYETEAGASIRFDDFSGASNGQLPIVKGDKVELSWRMSADGRMPIAVTVLKKKQ
ncbi:MAG: hypothetical protein WC815_04010 [Vicinamibacterales bacterium]|jgi:hypothetical protein